MKKILLFAIFLVSLSFLISSVKAVTYISGCSNLNIEGETYYLTQDIIDSFVNMYCMNISANNVILDCQSHTIDGVGAIETYGIYVYNVQNVTIKNCLLTDWDSGLYLYNSNSSTLLNINSNSNSLGIFFDSSSYNQIINSTITNGGIYFDPSSSYNQIINSIFNSNYVGISFDYSSYNQIINSTFNSNADGIFLCFSSHNQIINSTFNSNSIAGIYLNFGLNNTIYNNIIQNNTNGIWFYSSGSNKIYNNLFNNTNNFYFDGDIYSNYWNTTKQSGQRIYSLGNYIGGNYWTNPTGNGYSDICTDDDKDGFCDLPYDLLGNGTNVDYLPLSNEYVPPPNLPPEITIFLPLNQSYYGSINFAFKAMDDFDENFTVKTYLNNRLEYENLYYQNDTQISYSKFLPMGTYNFTVYAEDSYGASSQQEVIFASLGYCGDNVCQADYENSANCFKDCGGASKNFVFLVVVGLGIMGIVFGRDLVAGTKTTEEMVRTFVVILIILVVIGIIASTWL